MRDIKEFGAIGNNIADDTIAIRKALRECAGKDTLYISKGIYRTGALEIPSRSRIEFEDGATLSFIDDFSIYEPVMTRWEGVDCYAMHPLFFITDAEDIEITGNGILDGNGRKWWDYIYYRRADQKEPVTAIEKSFAELNPDYRNQPGGGGGRQTQFLRPPLFQIWRSRNIKIDGLELTNSPFWTLHPVYSNNLQFINMKIINPYVTPNTDGMDIESCLDVIVDNCYVDVGDDGIALKSGSGESGVEKAIPCKNITIRNSTVKQAHGGFVIGSETAAGMSHISVKDCRFIGTDRGIRIKTRRGRGGEIYDIDIENIDTEDVISPITINMYYKWGSDEPGLYSLEKEPITKMTPHIHDITIRGLRAKGCRASAGFIVGLPEMRITNVRIEDSVIDVVEKPEKGLEVEMYKGIPDTDYRGIRVRNADITLKNVAVNESPAMKEL